MSKRFYILPQSLRQQILNLLPWVFKFGVSAGLVWYLIEKIGGSNVVERAIELSPNVLFISIFLIIAQSFFAALRWALIIKAIGHNLSLMKAIAITFVSLFFSQFLPASVGGDAVRMWQSKKAGLPFNKAVTSVILERFVSLLSVATLSLMMLPVLTRHLPNPLMFQGSILITIGGLCALAILLFFDSLPIAWHRWRLVRGVAELAQDTRAIVKQPLRSASMVLTALIGQFLLATAAYSLAQGMGVGVSLIDFIAIMPAVVLVSSLPISVAGWGVRELAMVTALGLVGVSSDAAVAISVILALTASVASLPGGFLFVFYKLRDPSHNRSQSCGIV